MKSENPEIIKVKSTLHPRNKHRNGYDFKALIKSYPALEKFVKPNKYGNESIDFFKPAAVKALNKALLIKHYNIKEWDIPDNYLCPPIPGRADYLHAVADLLAEDNHGRIPKGDAVEILDIGVGANCIYPIIGIHEYQWKFMGSETDDNAIKAAIENAASNPEIIQNLQIRKQENSKHIFKNILKSDEQIVILLFMNLRKKLTKEHSEN
jgi:23S rRNA (adenine1618-N6)-methyltransferase